MTVGAAGGLNVILKTLLNPGDEVIVFAPYFGEYRSYAANYGESSLWFRRIPRTSSRIWQASRS